MVVDNYEFFRRNVELVNFFERMSVIIIDLKKIKYI